MIEFIDLLSYPEYLQWVKNLNRGETIEVYDNSYVYEVIPSKDFKKEKSLLIKNCCISAEKDTKLVIIDIYNKSYIVPLCKKVKNLPTVLVISSNTNKLYEIGICWSENETSEFREIIDYPSILK